MSNLETKRERLADDLLYGAQAIAKELGVTPMQVYHMARLKRLPIGHIGKNLIASRRQLQRAIATLTT